MTSIFPGGNASNAANITNKQQTESAKMVEKNFCREAGCKWSR